MHIHNLLQDSRAFAIWLPELRSGKETKDKTLLIFAPCARQVHPV